MARMARERERERERAAEVPIEHHGHTLPTETSFDIRTRHTCHTRRGEVLIYIASAGRRCEAIQAELANLGKPEIRLADKVPQYAV